MSFFGKLKARMFKSSSKIEEGLDALVEEGGTVDPVEEAPAETTAGRAAGGPEVGAPPSADPTPEVESTSEAAVETASEPARTPEPESPAAFTPERRPADEVEPAPALAPRPEPAPPPAAPEPTPETPTRTPSPAAVPSPVPPPVRPTSDGRTADMGPAPTVTPTPAAATAEEGAARRGLMDRLLRRGPAVTRRELDDDMLESLEEVLIQADMGVDTALKVSAAFADGRMGKRFSTDELKGALATEIGRIMEPVARPLPLYPRTPQVVLVVGVNGSGKTTTIGKLASQFRAAGKSVMIAAGDTFRAAAVEQLQVWGERAGVPVMTAPEGSDPASLAFDAMARAEAEGADLLMIDTAGRLQNRSDLMEELAKIVRVIRKKDPSAPHNTLLVLDATTGQNALRQVEEFQRLADVSGLVMTKLDGTARGGVLVALADRFGLPIHAIGVGEQIDDLAPFEPEEFARALVGAE